MTPEKAEEIYHAARLNKYETFKNDYCPLNQRLVILAGFQAVIDAVTEEVQSQETVKFVNQYLCASSSAR